MDDADRAQSDIDKLGKSDVDRVRTRASLIPNGEPGECDYCGEQSLRLVCGNCARCRDKYKLP
jgi:hypothetical protein